MLLLTELLKTILVRDSAIVHVFLVQCVRKLVQLVNAHHLTEELEHVQRCRHSQRLDENLTVELGQIATGHIDWLGHLHPFGLNFGYTCLTGRCHDGCP